MNILFANYGDFTANSLNHIGLFAAALQARGHACVVAVPQGAETISAIARPQFTPATFAEVLARPAFFPDGRVADIVHAWTPRENVRQFVLAYQRAAHARLIVHLEDNEEHLLAAQLDCPTEQLRQPRGLELADDAPAALSHPLRHRLLLQAADGITAIIDTLRSFAPADVPFAVLPPGVDFTCYQPQEPDPALRRELGLEDGERVLVFTGSNTFANEHEIRELYLAVGLLNQRGVRTRLIRTGLYSTQFREPLPVDLRAHVLDLGFVEKARLPRLIALADALVQPGHPGPFNDFRLPSKIPELLSMGRAVVLPATNVGRELRDGEDALLLHTGTPEEMADACERLFEDPALARRLGANALAFARRHYDLGRNTEALAEFYRQVCARPARSGATAELGADESELALTLRTAAAALPDRAIAARLVELVPFVTHLELQKPALAAIARLTREVEEWKRRHELTNQHAHNLRQAAEDLAQAIETRRQLTDQHIANLDGIIASQRQQLQALETRAGELERHLAAAHATIAARDATIAQRDAKLAAIHRSGSWRYTAPFRWLRRKLFDR
ncbi:MAG: glycosyltransferase family 4 protein [Opitutae bacterium]|nr:glycosyltransferase family 4 protein [Opitutae bacterium]